MRVLLLALLLFWSVPAYAQQTWSEFPPDDPKLTVVDRAFKSLYTGDGEAHFYAVLSSDTKQSYLDVYKGLPWRRIHRWSLEFQGTLVKVRDRTVLQISHDEESQRLDFYWDEWAGYAEAAVHQVLIYDRKTGKFSTNWSD